MVYIRPSKRLCESELKYLGDKIGKLDRAAIGLARSLGDLGLDWAARWGVERSVGELGGPKVSVWSLAVSLGAARDTDCDAAENHHLALSV